MAVPVLVSIPVCWSPQIKSSLKAGRRVDRINMIFKIRTATNPVHLVNPVKHRCHVQATRYTKHDDNEQRMLAQFSRDRAR